MFCFSLNRTVFETSLFLTLWTQFILYVHIPKATILSSSLCYKLDAYRTLHINHTHTSSHLHIRATHFLALLQFHFYSLLFTYRLNVCPVIFSLLFQLLLCSLCNTFVFLPLYAYFIPHFFDPFFLWFVIVVSLARTAIALKLIQTWLRSSIGSTRHRVASTQQPRPIPLASSTQLKRL